MDQKTLVKRGAYKCVHINTWRVCQRSHGVMVSTLDLELIAPVFFLSCNAIFFCVDILSLMYSIVDEAN